jgi:IPT/TIG domain/FG-GAP repeat
MTRPGVLAAEPQVRRRRMALATLTSLSLAIALSQLVLAAGHSAARPAAAGKQQTGRLSSLAPSARALLSSAIGAGDGAYRLAPAADGFQAHNPAQHLSVAFDPTGASLRSHGLSVGLSLHAAGYGSSLGAVAAARPQRSAANRVLYSRPAIDEWYANGPLGVEQGFTIAHPLRPGAAGVLALSIVISGDVQLALAPGGRSLELHSPSGGALAYGDLSASDANGHTLHSWMTVDGHQVLLHVDSTGASFPITVDPLIEAEPEAALAPAAGEVGAGGRFGLSVALSGDGNTALVGAPAEDGGDGAAWVFTRTASGWAQQGPKLSIPEAGGENVGCSHEADEEEGEEGEETGPESRGCRFGQRVSLSADGSIAVIGAPCEDAGEGVAWIFTRSGSTWSPTSELTSPEPGVKRRFGAAVSVSGDGSTVIVGAPRLRGRAWLFTRSGSTWVAQSPALSGAGEEGEGFFGHSVALSTGGETALVGAPGNSSDRGAVWAFKRTGTGWEQEGSMLTGDGETPGGRFGSSLALSGDAGTALIGARRDDDGSGAAWAFANSGSTWSEQGPMLAGSEAGEEFGYSVALSSDGEKALIGAADADGDRGEASVFERSGSTWNEAQTKLGGGSSETSNAHFGSSAALSSDGKAMLLGGRFEEKGDVAWVFGPRPSVGAVKPPSGPSDGGTTVTIEGENLTEATAVRFAAKDASSFTVASSKSIEAVSPSGTGTVDITVETPAGISAITTVDQFTYTVKAGKGGGKNEGSGGGEQPGGSVPTTDGGGSAGSGEAAAVGEGGVLAYGASTDPACAASLRSQQISVQLHYRALLKLVGTGTGACSGTLRLRVKLKLSNKRYETKTIGTADFTISSGKAATVLVKLNAAGRRLLKHGHGRLSATLLIVKALPTPVLARTASVHLVNTPAAPSKHGAK